MSRRRSAQTMWGTAAIGCPRSELRFFWVDCDRACLLVHKGAELGSKPDSRRRLSPHGILRNSGFPARRLWPRVLIGKALARRRLAGMVPGSQFRYRRALPVGSSLLQFSHRKN